MNDLTIMPRGKSPPQNILDLEAVEVRPKQAEPPHAEAPRPARNWFGPIASVTRNALALWGGISLVAVGGYAVGAVINGPDTTQVLASEDSVKLHAASIPAAEPVTSSSARQHQPIVITATPAEVTKRAEAESGPGLDKYITATPSRPAAKPAPREPVGPAEAASGPQSEPVEAAPEPATEPVEVARLPRPRPEAPMVTASVHKRAVSPRNDWYADRQYRRQQTLYRYGPPLDFYRHAFRDPYGYGMPQVYYFPR
jgi:hypothetical protein